MTRSAPAAAVLLFLSGFTGLIYELTWSKRLANVLGSSGQAHAIVLATFMGGLALGAFLFGRAADRASRPLALYGVLEIGVGGLALVFPALLGALEGVYLGLARGVLDGVLATAARLLLAAMALLLPTLLMGGSLPAMTRHLTGSMAGARATLARLYGINSLGAAAGCLVAGLALIPAGGLLATERLGAVVNLSVGAAAVLLARRTAPGAGEAPSGPGPAPHGVMAVRVALLGTAVTGFTSMLYQTVWIRVLSMVIGGTSYAFTLIVAAFIAGIALGSLWLSRRADGDGVRLFGWLQVGLIGAVLAVLPFYERLPYQFLSLHAVLAPTEAGWPLYQGLTFLFCTVVLVGPTFFLGAAFPAAARVVLRSERDVGARLGLTSLFNTAGTVSGALLGGLWLVPALGLEGCVLLGLSLNLVAAGLALGTTGPRGVGRWAVPAAVALCIAAGAAGSRGWALTVATSGRYREWNRTFQDFASFRAAVASRSEVRLYRDDVFASVLVGEQAGGRRYLRINGKVDGSNGRDADTQILAGHLGMLLHPGEVKRVLLVGVGAGITAGSLLAHDLERLDVVEISPAVVDAARLFAPDNRHALDDPRCRVTIEDARTFLTLATEPYDLIVSVPSNPWVSGVSGLFSADFFAVARTRLREGGLIVQWIHTYESSVPVLRLVARTLLDTFPHATTWVGPDDLVFVAGRAPLAVDPHRLAGRMARPEVAADLGRLGISRVSTLLARQVHSGPGLAAFAGAGPLNTDDHNRLEYLSPVAYFVSRDVEVPDERRAPVLGRTLAIAPYLAGHPLDAAGAEELYRHLVRLHLPADSLVVTAASRWHELEPARAEAAVALARSRLAQGDVEATLELLRPVLDADGPGGAGGPDGGPAPGALLRARLAPIAPGGAGGPDGGRAPGALHAARLDADAPGGASGPGGAPAARVDQLPPRLEATGRPDGGVPVPAELRAEAWTLALTAARSPVRRGQSPWRQVNDCSLLGEATARFPRPTGELAEAIERLAAACLAP